MPALLDDLKQRVDVALKTAVIGAIAAGAAIGAFFCFAILLFLWTWQTYGVLEAWFVLGALFAAVALIGLIAILVVRRRTRAAPRESNTSTTARLLQDPAVILSGLQAVRAIGPGRLLPLLMVGAVIAGFALSRSEASRHPPAADDTTDPG